MRINQLYFRIIAANLIIKETSREKQGHLFLLTRIEHGMHDSNKEQMTAKQEIFNPGMFES